MHDLVIPWEGEGGSGALIEWIDELLDGLGLRRTGSLEQVHLRPWSTVIRVPLEGSSCFAKSSAPALRHEAALTEWLARRWPEDISQVIAANADRGWLLLGDGGKRMREVLTTEDGPEVWDPVLKRYAAIQIQARDSVEELLGLGVPDRRPGLLASRLSDLLRAVAAWGNEDEPPLTDQELHRLSQAVEDVRQRGDALSALQISASIDHGDLHDGNVFSEGDSLRLFDWGDTGVGHPFFSLRTTLVSAEYRFDLAEDDLLLERLRQVYLERWLDGASQAQLDAAFELARSIWAIPAALRWYAALRGMDSPARSEFSAALPSLLRELLDELGKQA